MLLRGPAGMIVSGAAALAIARAAPCLRLATIIGDPPAAAASNDNRFLGVNRAPSICFGDRDHD
jgi:hypothetical protein